MKINKNSFTSLMEIAIQAAVKGGNIIQSHADDARRRFHKKESFRDVVTAIEVYAQEEIIKVLNSYREKYQIVAEEKEIPSKVKINRTYWLVDPLDGTVNYLYHIPFYSVSIAFIFKGEPVAGVVFNPYTKELFYGAKELGAYKNKHKINTISKKPEQTIFAVSFSGKNYFSLTERKKEFLEFEKVNDSTMGCLRTGSAALNLAYCAQGSFGGCWGKANKWWDVAAGLLLVKLAGGNVNWRFLNKDEWLVEYSAGNLPKL